MRFPADDIWKVRSGEQTRLTFPYERRRCQYQEGGYYVLERTIDVSREVPCQACDQTGERKDGKPCGRCKGHGSRVYYTTRTERTDWPERIHIYSVEKVHPQELTDAQALEEGWESAEEWREAFFATHGEVEFAWTITFECTSQVPQYLANQQGQVDPPQYVTTPARAIDDLDAPSGEEYRAWAEKADSELRRQREIKRLEQRRTAIEDKIAQLRRKAA